MQETDPTPVAAGTEDKDPEPDNHGEPKSHECDDRLDSETRDEVLEKYEYRCQACGRRGPERGGLATMHVHHIERDPEEMDLHDPANLTVLCRSCHTWLHHQSKPDDSPVDISKADQTVLLPQDIEILRFLAQNGPTRTGTIAAELTGDFSVPSVRERLWVLMGLDNLVDSRDRQVVDKDIETGEWGLTEQIENSARGHIPDDPQLLLQRMEDEQIRQALDRGCDRRAVQEVFDVVRRTTFSKQKRAAAYDFPLDAFSRRGGRPSTSDRDADSSSGDGDRVVDDGQTRFDELSKDHRQELEPIETWGSADPNTDGVEASSAGDSTNADLNAVEAHLTGAIEALQSLNRES